MREPDDGRFDDLCRFATRPLAFMFRYVSRRAISHGLILCAVLTAVACSVTTQYGVKLLVDALADGSRSAVWWAFVFLSSFIAADNLLWRLASWIASHSFVAVTGDLRRDLFRHLTGHAPSYFSDRMPGMLTSRVTATSNAVFTAENMFVWNVLPPCAATVCAISLVGTVSLQMALGLTAIAGIVVVAIFRMAAAGRPLHHDFADKAATVDGEMVDVISNLSMVKAFSGIGREHRRFDATVSREMTARRRSLLYLERLRLIHAVTTVLLTIGLLGWALALWRDGTVTTGEVVLVCTLGLSVLHATRDLAVALVDITQHLARLSEALETLLLPHELRDHPEAEPLSKRGTRVTFENVTFRYPDGRQVFDNFNLDLRPGERVGLIGRSGGGKSTMFGLLQRLYDVQHGQILVGGQDIRRVTQESLRSVISVVPQDITLFNRTLMDNIRYSRPNSSNDDVMAAAVAARCDFIDGLPDGLMTVVGDRGMKLSGGQRQRIALARAFLKDAPILLFDEATSALDGESEEAIREAVSLLMRDRTVIAIAHRASTLSSVDRIIALEDGRITQDGAPNELMERDGFFRDLVQRELRNLGRRAA